MNMQLVTDHIHDRRQTFVCLRCNGRVVSPDYKVYADLDGVPFRAYYCEPCKEILTEGVQL